METLLQVRQSDDDDADDDGDARMGRAPNQGRSSTLSGTRFTSGASTSRSQPRPSTKFTVPGTPSVVSFLDELLD